MNDSDKNPVDDDLKPEYQFDYARAKPNRFAARFGGKTRVVLLDDDVSKVFHTSESVNKVLRALMQTMPQTAANVSP